MPKKYKETPVTGSAWLHCNSIGIQLPYNAPISYAFVEEKVLHANDSSIITQPAGALSGMLDPDNIIEVIDPETAVPTGETFTEGYLYQLLISMYAHLAQARDDAAAVVLQIGEED